MLQSAGDRSTAGLGRILGPRPHDLGHPGAVGERLAVAGRAGAIGIDHRRITEDRLDQLVGLADRDDRPVLVATEGRDRQSVGDLYGVLVGLGQGLILGLILGDDGLAAEKDGGGQHGQHQQRWKSLHDAVLGSFLTMRRGCDRGGVVSIAPWYRYASWIYTSPTGEAQPPLSFSSLPKRGRGERKPRQWLGHVPQRIARSRHHSSQRDERRLSCSACSASASASWLGVSGRPCAAPALPPFPPPVVRDAGRPWSASPPASAEAAGPAP